MQFVAPYLCVPAPPHEKITEFFHEGFNLGAPLPSAVLQVTDFNILTYYWLLLLYVRREQTRFKTKLFRLNFIFAFLFWTKVTKIYFAGGSYKIICPRHSMVRRPYDPNM